LTRYYNADIVIYGLLIAGIWQGTGLVMCIMLAGLRGIDEDIWKAAPGGRYPDLEDLCPRRHPDDAPRLVTTLVLVASGVVKL
jgi:glucose/mannose transport system permease protein